MYFIKMILLMALFSSAWVPIESMPVQVDFPQYSSKDKTPPPEGEEDETEELAARSS